MSTLVTSVIVIMKRLVSTCMVIVILFSLTEFHEFVKIPFAIGHYIEHYHENSTISIVDFLTEHYSSNDAHSEEHTSLPFKGHCASIVIPLILFSVTTSSSIVLPTSKIQYFLFSNKTTSLGNKLGVWQPPQSLSLS